MTSDEILEIAAAITARAAPHQEVVTCMKCGDATRIRWEPVYPMSSKRPAIVKCGSCGSEDVK